MILNDLRYGAKKLWKSKGLTAVALVSLAVGIGANSAVFSVVNSFLLRPRPVSKPEQLVEVYVGARTQPYDTTSYPSYLELRDRNEVFTELAAYGIRSFKLGPAKEVEVVWGEAVSGNYFDVLGIPAFKGRTFASDEDLVPGKNPVVVISHALWQRRFNSDPEIVGKTVTINEQALTVIGIAAPQYTGMFRGFAMQIWVPITMVPSLEGTQGERVLTHSSRWLTLVGRLKPETTLAQARARFDLLTRDMQGAHPEEWNRKSESTGAERPLFVSVLPESETRIHPQMQSAAYALAALLFVIVNLVLLIACMNLASMLLARAVARRKEIAVRLALGASRWRIIRQLLIESVLLSLIAGVAGIVLAVWLLALPVAFMPPLPEGIRLAFDLSLDWRVVLFTIAFSTITGILFGLAPALQSSKADVSTVLKNDSSNSTGFYRKSRLRMSLVVIQVAFSFLLLIGAGLALRMLEKIRPTKLGFTSDNVLVALLDLDEGKYDRVKKQEFYRQLAERVSSLPGVQTVSLVDEMPGGFMTGANRSVAIEGYHAPGQSVAIESVIAGPNYFTNMKVPFVQGRDFNDRDRDNSPCVAIVNEAFAQKYFSTAGAALGKHLTAYRRLKQNPSCEIVGVIRDNKLQSLQKEVQPFFALTVQQSERDRMQLLVNTTGDPEALTVPVRNSILELDPNMPVTDVQTVTEYFDFALYPFRILAVVMGACGVMALVLATIGVYGVVSYSVAQRTRELGIRMALGALQKDILGLVIRQGMVLVTVGLAVGLLLSVAVTRVLTSSLFEVELLQGVSATDSLTFASVTMLLAFVALVACYIPARRATKVDPIEALRYE